MGSYVHQMCVTRLISVWSWVASLQFRHDAEWIGDVKWCQIWMIWLGHDITVQKWVMSHTADGRHELILWCVWIIGTLYSVKYEWLDLVMTSRFRNESCHTQPMDVTNSFCGVSEFEGRYTVSHMNDLTWSWHHGSEMSHVTHSRWTSRTHSVECQNFKDVTRCHIWMAWLDDDITVQKWVMSHTADGRHELILWCV